MDTALSRDVLFPLVLCNLVLRMLQHLAWVKRLRLNLVEFVLPNFYFVVMSFVCLLFCFVDFSKALGQSHAMQHELGPSVL